jgi:hypothetical protein
VCVDDSFLYDGRRRSFISSLAVRVLATSEAEKSPKIFAALDDLESRFPFY